MKTLSNQSQKDQAKDKERGHLIERLPFHVVVGGIRSSCARPSQEPRVAHLIIVLSVQVSDASTQSSGRSQSPTGCTSCGKAGASRAGTWVGRIRLSREARPLYQEAATARPISARHQRVLSPRQSSERTVRPGTSHAVRAGAPAGASLLAARRLSFDRALLGGSGGASRNHPLPAVRTAARMIALS